MKYSVVITAGGLGTRMSGILGKVPKILAPVYEKDFLNVVLDEWERIGMKRFHFLLGNGAAKIWEACEAWKKKRKSRMEDMELSATIEPNSLGVGGALYMSRNWVSNPFIFTYGDVFPTVNVWDMIKKYEKSPSNYIAICQQDIANEKGNVEIENFKVTKYSKEFGNLKYVDVGMKILQISDLENNKQGFLNEEDLLFHLVKKEKLFYYLHDLPSRHIGDPDSYKDFLDWYKREKRLERDGGFNGKD